MGKSCGRGGRLSDGGMRSCPRPVRIGNDLSMSLCDALRAVVFWRRVAVVDVDYL